jgi:hypothetical protein
MAEARGRAAEIDLLGPHTTVCMAFAPIHGTAELWLKLGTDGLSTLAPGLFQMSERRRKKIGPLKPLQVHELC